MIRSTYVLTSGTATLLRSSYPLIAVQRRRISSSPPKSATVAEVPLSSTSTSQFGIVQEYDVVVAGSGVGGLTAALTAASLGQRVLVLEKASVLGGTTAFSGGVAWLPSMTGTPASVAASLPYIKGNAAPYYEEKRAFAYANNAKAALEFVEDKTGLRYKQWIYPDYNQEIEGASKVSKSMAPTQFNARTLSKSTFAKLRPPLKTFTVLGGMGVPMMEVLHFENYSKTLKSFLIVVKYVLRHLFDLATVGRGTNLTGGNALIAALLKANEGFGVDIRTSSPVQELLMSADKQSVIGVKTFDDGTPVTVRAKKGIVLATGGFPADPVRQIETFPYNAGAKGHRTVAPRENTGDGLRLGESVGGKVSTDVNQPGAWVPASAVPQGDGSTILFPHFGGRGKPGSMIVDRRGNRFFNEALSYMVAGGAILKACRDDEKVEVFMIADHKAVKRDGLGIVPPGPTPFGQFIKSGYLVRGETLEELAAKLNIDGRGLVETVKEFNVHAWRGEDPLFQRGHGHDAYQISNGLKGHKPNANLGPLEKGPYYGVRMTGSSIGTFAGLKTDEKARVLSYGKDGKESGVVKGLYAVGTDMSSSLGGTYPAAGINVGAAMAFGMLAGKDIVEKGRSDQQL